MHCCFVSGFVNDLNIGGLVLIDDGDLELEVIDKTADYLLCEVKTMQRWEAARA